MRRFALVAVLAALATSISAGGTFAAAAQLGEGQAVEAPSEATKPATEDPEAEPSPGVARQEAIEEPRPQHRPPEPKVERGSEIVAPEDEASTGAKEETEAAVDEEAASGESSDGGAGEGAFSSTGLGGGSGALGELEVPTELLPVYEACGTRYGISWEVLAAINKVETGFGSNLGTSSAGAEGWMQFMPSSWKQWGVDANGDGTADSSDPVDAICAAARYLAASGGEEDIYDAVLAYNHADWYAQEVLALARRYERVPANLVNSLSTLAEGSTFPVDGKITSWKGGETATVDGERGAAVRAVVDGSVTKVGADSFVLTDPYGDRIDYWHLGSTTVKEGESVQAGDALGRVGSSGVALTIRPDAAGSAIDATELLELWRKGGVGVIYGVDTAGASEGSRATRSLLMSAGALRREVLADPKLELPSCVRKAVAGGGLQRQALAALEYLTASGHRLGVGASTCEHDDGFTVELDLVDGESVGEGQGSGTVAHSLVQTVVAMDTAAAPQTVASSTGIAAGETGGTRRDTIALDYRPPGKARIVVGDAVAPTDAPAAVQAIIAAANQINETPYVWGGGHGSWVSAGYDCSGSVSYVLHAAEMLSEPETSGALESWGESGSGKWVTVYANAEHTYAVIAGLRWDTVGDAIGTGPRWHTGAAYPQGFTIRHPTGY